jgi:hypothetical protein
MELCKQRRHVVATTSRENQTSRRIDDGLETVNLTKYEKNLK